jgi:hypothetical protein
MRAIGFHCRIKRTDTTSVSAACQTAPDRLRAVLPSRTRAQCNDTHTIEAPTAKRCWAGTRQRRAHLLFAAAAGRCRWSIPQQGSTPAGTAHPARASPHKPEAAGTAGTHLKEVKCAACSGRQQRAARRREFGYPLLSSCRWQGTGGSSAPQPAAPAAAAVQAATWQWQHSSKRPALAAEAAKLGLPFPREDCKPEESKETKRKSCLQLELRH